MSGADYRQQQELEEMQWSNENEKINPAEFVAGQKAARNGFTVAIDDTKSFARGFKAETDLESLKWM